MPQSYADDLLTYFTDVENLRDLFKAYLAAPELPKHILVIHGVGGIGKSSLLRMFRLHCKSIKTPVALASGDEAKSAFAILGNWADDLKADGVTLPTFAETRQHYRSILARAEDKAQESRKKMGDLAGKTAGKVAETAAGAAVGAAIGSIIPGIGTIAGALGGMGAEALVDWLRGQGFAKPDIDLLLDPAKKLTDDFLADVERVAPKRRLVLMLDTFEQLSALEDWARDLAERLHPNVLLVISGRAMPKWGRPRPGWLAQAHVEELKPMTDDVMRDLVRRYYAAMRGGEPDPKQVEAIIGFARGLPMVVTSAVQLWVEHGVEDFEVVKPEVVADLVDRLKEGVPEAMTPVLEAAATVRWFNKDVLGVVSSQADVNKAFDELRRFPFVRSRVEGLALHDAMREIMDDYLRMLNPERHRELHERAAVYFEAQMAKRTDEEAERLGLERLYQRICADEEVGLQLFQKMAEELVRYRTLSRFRALLSDVNTYSLRRENSRLWREYYNARLLDLEFRVADAEKVYQELGENERVDAKLRAYALCDWGGTLATDWHLGQTHGAERAIQTLERSLGFGLPDSHLNQSFLWLGRVARYQGDWDKQIEYLEKARNQFDRLGDIYGVISIYVEMKRTHARRGQWNDFFATHKRAVAALSRMPTTPSVLKADLWGHWGWAWALAGRFTEGEQNAREALKIAHDLQLEFFTISLWRDLAWTLGVQGKFKDAYECFDKSLIIIHKRFGRDTAYDEGATLAFLGAILSRNGHPEPARHNLIRSREIADSLHAIPGTIESLTWLGLAAEVQHDWEDASRYYRSRTEWKWYGSNYFQCSALTGLVRVKHAQGEYDAVPPLLVDAEHLAQKYEYNDHLASLRLTQGHVAWDGHTSEWGSGFDAALRYYQHVLIYALRYNRFLLDEALSGRPQGTPLRPIIPHCLERGEERRRMLTALRDWWQTGINDVGTQRSDTISPIPEGIPLLEAERIAREREPGDGSPQRTVLEQIDAVLSR